MASISKLKIEIERRKLRKLIANARARLQELDVAARVLGRLGARPVRRPKSQANKLNGKPANMPSMPNMIKVALQQSKDGLEPRQMVKFIAKQWWPEVPPEYVGPIAWRMFQRGDLRKRGAKYILPKSKCHGGDEAAKTN